MGAVEPAAGRFGGCVVVVGGGVVGLTTALVLEATGVATTLVTDIAAGASPPELASAHAAASVLAHSVRSSRSDPGTRASTVVLETLGDDPAWGSATRPTWS